MAVKGKGLHGDEPSEGRPLPSFSRRELAGRKACCRCCYPRQKQTVYNRSSSRCIPGGYFFPPDRLTRVYVRVLLHVGLLVKPFPAELTRVRPRVRVYQQMRGQRGRPLERLAALFALEQLFHAVRRPPTAQPSADDEKHGIGDVSRKTDRDKTYNSHTRVAGYL